MLPIMVTFYLMDAVRPALNAGIYLRFF